MVAIFPNVCLWQRIVYASLLHRMALVSSRLFCKNLGNLQEFFWANGLPPPLAENCPYAYVIVSSQKINLQETSE